MPSTLQTPITLGGNKMNYSQKTQNKAKEITVVADGFNEVRDRLDILRALDLSAFDDRLGLSVMYIVDDAIDVIDAIECKLYTDSNEDGLSLEESLTK